MMAERIVATFDIGGTNMRAAVLSVGGGDWRLLDQMRRSTPNYLLAAGTPIMQRVGDLLDFLADYSRFASESFGAQSMVVSIPGPVGNNGDVLALPTMWGPDSQKICPFDLAGELRIRLPRIMIKIINDVSAAGYRFIHEGSDFAIFTLGSGLGLKVFIDGKPQVGLYGRGGELAHMVFDTSHDAPLCDCGGRGHLGALVSGRAWQRTIESAQKEGCLPELENFVEPLARAIAMLHFSLGLERIILAGGLVEGLGEQLRAALVSKLPSQGWNVNQDWNAMLQLAPPDDMHALIGGALAFVIE